MSNSIAESVPLTNEEKVLCYKVIFQDLKDKWLEFKKLPVIEQHTKPCELLMFYHEQKCTCDHGERVKKHIILWNEIRTLLDEL